MKAVRPHRPEDRRHCRGHPGFFLRSRFDDLKAGALLLLERETNMPDDFAPIRRASEILGRGVIPPATDRAATSSSNS